MYEVSEVRMAVWGRVKSLGEKMFLFCFLIFERYLLWKEQQGQTAGCEHVHSVFKDRHR